MNLQTRFHELVRKEALGTITPEELAKLERIDRLLSPPDPADERWSYAQRCLMKKARFFAWQALSEENGRTGVKRTGVSALLSTGADWTTNI